MAVLKRSSEIVELLITRIGTICSVSIRHDDLLGVCTNYQVRIVTHHDNLPFLLPRRQISDKHIVDRAAVEVILRLID